MGAGFLWMTASRRESPIEVAVSSIHGGSIVFAFNDQVELEEVQVIRRAVEPAEDAGVYVAPSDEIVWHLVSPPPAEGKPAPETIPMRALRYGQGIHGLRRAAGTPSKPAPLQPGVEYLFKATVAEGEIELPFTLMSSR